MSVIEDSVIERSKVKKNYITDGQNHTKMLLKSAQSDEKHNVFLSVCESCNLGFPCRSVLESSVVFNDETLHKRLCSRLVLLLGALAMSAEPTVWRRTMTGDVFTPQLQTHSLLTLTLKPSLKTNMGNVEHKSSLLLFI